MLIHSFTTDADVLIVIRPKRPVDLSDSCQLLVHLHPRTAAMAEEQLAVLQDQCLPLH